MKAIETEYAGYKFRSRLEARYAVFFDHLRTGWEYEPEGYDLDDGDYYLPDFWMTDLKCFVEIKGQEPNEDELRKARKLYCHTEKAIALFHGMPMENYGLWMCWDQGESAGTSEWLVQWADRGGDGISFYLPENATSDRVYYQDPWMHSITITKDRVNIDLCGTLARAEMAAKQARFEHGETPSRPYTNIVDYDDIKF